MVDCGLDMRVAHIVGNMGEGIVAHRDQHGAGTSRTVGNGGEEVISSSADHVGGVTASEAGLGYIAITLPSSRLYKELCTESNASVESNSLSLKKSNYRARVVLLYSRRNRRADGGGAP